MSVIGRLLVAVVLVRSGSGFGQAQKVAVAPQKTFRASERERGRSLTEN
jgi:hypothetical protein